MDFLNIPHFQSCQLFTPQTSNKCPCSYPV